MMIGKHETRQIIPSASIVQSLRQRIISGEYPRGSRLPSRNELRQKYSSTSATIQRVFDTLQKDGFVVARGATGTFVSESPPHLCHYALVLPPLPESPPQFWHTLERAAEEWKSNINDNGTDRPVQFIIAHAPTTPTSAKEFERLARLVESDRIAGLIFADSARPFLGSTILGRSGIPRIAITAKPEIKGVGSIQLSGFLELSLDYLRQCGRRRVAVLAPVTANPEMYLNAIRNAGFETQPRWIQAIYYGQPSSWVRNLVQLVVDRYAPDKPDALIVSDDNVVAAAAEGLKKIGIRVPDDLSFVGHANFPDVSRTVVPVKRFGYDSRNILRAAIHWIDAKRNSEAINDVVKIKAVSD